MTEKIKRIIPLAFLVLSLTGLALLVSWFFVRGAEFRLMKEFPEDMEIVCTRQIWNPTRKEHEEEEIPLSRQQLAEVLTLVRKNAYWRMLNKTIVHNEDVSYYILCTFTQDSQKEFITVSVIGNYAVACSDSLEDTVHEGFLRILSKDFLEKLETILAK